MALVIQFDASACYALHKKEARVAGSRSDSGGPLPLMSPCGRVALGQLATLLVAEPTMISPVVCNVPPMI